MNRRFSQKHADDTDEAGKRRFLFVYNYNRTQYKICGNPCFLLHLHSK
jgi:hypothetical protein